jgi:4,5-dihydroxyphthalate decarboxylase
MPDVRLTAVTRPQGANAALVDGSLRPRGFAFDWVDVPVLPRAFRRMVRTLEFDVSEMAATTYLCAREHGVRFTALPVFLVRGFHHGAILHNTKSGITGPHDLAGRRVGVNRGWTVTTGVWARGILAEEYGVDLKTVQWVRSGDEHVEAYVPPAYVTGMPEGKDLAGMLVAGELDAVIGVEVDDPDVAPLIPDPDETAFAALEKTGLYPINHLVVIKDDVLKAHPTAAEAIYEAFVEAKNRYVERLTADEISDPTPADRRLRRIHDLTGGDPLPYGVDANRPMLERLMRHAVDQRILTRSVPLESLFATV